MLIRVLVVDDEPLARAGLREFLTAEPDVVLVGECGDGRSAIRLIQAERPTLVFLDIALPEASGFEVLRALPPAEMPVVVFVTAHDRFALEAFEAHAMDYLLKPVERRRFGIAMERARAALRYRSAESWPARLEGLLAELGSPPRYRQRLLVRDTGRSYLVQTAEIDWIEAAGNYARLHAGGRRHLLRETLTRLEQELDPARFCRIHRSAIVNLDRIRELQPWTRGDQVVLLQDGTRLTLSARFRPELERRIGPAR